MDKLPIIEIKELNSNIASIDSFQDVLSVAKLDGGMSFMEEKEKEKDGFSSPVRLNALLMVLVLKGKAHIRLDYLDYTIEENSFITIMPSHIIQTAPVDKDFKAIMLVADQTFMEELRPENRSPSMIHYMQLRKNPCAVLGPDEAKHLQERFSLLKDKIKLRSHFFHKEVIQNAFMAFMLELTNIFVSKKDSIGPPTLSRKEEILNEFLQLLVIHCKEHHVVTFYAERLFITPQYLSLVLKELTGKSANKWIDEALMVEARILLKMPHATVQQAADMLNFSDQSTFGKFFKKHMGVSPMEYRKSI